MLVLSRKLNEKVLFPGIQAAVQVVAIKGAIVRLGIDAPPEVEVWREELAGAARGQAAAGRRTDHPPQRSRLDEIQRLLEKRLGIAGKGLAVLRQQLGGGLEEDALLTLGEVEGELELLRERIRGEAGTGAAGGRGATHRRRALLVEDNPQERELLALFLRTEGLDVDTAGDGCDALDYLKARGRPDFVLLDMGLPRLDGPTAVQEIRRNPACAGLKIFAVSGHAADEYDLAIGPTGVDRWFQKPVDPITLVRELDRELAQAV
jgi:two-component system, OmpR family, response regulator